MSEYINREEFLESKIYLYCHDCSRRKNRKGEMVYEIGDAPCRACGIGDVLDDVIDFPSADVAEVVRCKDCKRSRSYPGGLVCAYGLLVNTIVEEDFFCADGERRSE